MNRCPTPWKRRYSSAPLAHRALDRLIADQRIGPDTTLNVYRCGGHWHLGHSNRALGPVGKALRAAGWPLPRR